MKSYLLMRDVHFLIFWGECEVEMILIYESYSKHSKYEATKVERVRYEHDWLARRKFRYDGLNVIGRIQKCGNVVFSDPRKPGGGWYSTTKQVVRNRMAMEAFAEKARRRWHEIVMLHKFVRRDSYGLTPDIDDYLQEPGGKRPTSNNIISIDSLR